MKAQKVKVAGRGEETLGDLADKALQRSRAMQRRMQKARRALLRDAEVEEEVIETDDATLLVARVAAVVVDPAALAAELPELASLQRPGATSKIKAAQLTGEARTNFEEMKAEVQAKPADHPLKKALAQGDQALLDALARGEGDVEVTTTVVVPKELPAIQGGRLMVPAVDEDSGFVIGKVAPIQFVPAPLEGRLATPLVFYPMAAAEPAGPEPVTAARPPTTTETGVAKATHKYVLGFTETGSWEWEDKWSFLNAYVTISAGASYGFGLRVPVRIDTEITPKKLVLKNAAKDEPGEYTVKVTAKTVDGNLDFYKEAEVPVADRHDGKELVMEASVWFKVKGSLDLWLDEVKRTVQGGTGFDYGRHFLPPHGDCGAKCGFDFWIPATITRTHFDVAVVKGDA
ncbi:MAG: hypothetical protein KC933_40880, partial [Myxococcales bacterium]|nr:hypothetical protein [Myxococcales bacterium]